MPQIYKVLGQAYPTATTDTTLYTVPALTQTVVSTIVACNQTTAPSTFRIAVRPAGASIVSQHYLAFDVVVPANDTIPLTIGITLNTTDVITVRSSSGAVSFSAFGSEVV
jgi:hypothetical protein